MSIYNDDFDLVDEMQWKKLPLPKACLYPLNTLNLKKCRCLSSVVHLRCLTASMNTPRGSTMVMNQRSALFKEAV